MATQKEILIKVIESISKKLIDAEKILTDLDSIGDADCGAGVRRGFEAVQGVMNELPGMDLGDILKKVGFTLAYTIGGTSGAMLGTGFIETGKSIAEIVEPSGQDWVTAVDNALAVIKRRGGNTQIGDKTLVDSLEPAVETMKQLLNPGQQQPDTVQLVKAAYMAAKAGSDRTVDMIAKKGRASYVGERSRGNRDPGSLVIVLMFEAALETVKGA